MVVVCRLVETSDPGLDGDHEDDAEDDGHHGGGEIVDNCSDTNFSRQRQVHGTCNVADFSQIFCSCLYDDSPMAVINEGMTRGMMMHLSILRNRFPRNPT